MWYSVPVCALTVLVHALGRDHAISGDAVSSWGLFDGSLSHWHGSVPLAQISLTGRGKLCSYCYVSAATHHLPPQAHTAHYTGTE